MPLIHVNAGPHGPELHDRSGDVRDHLPGVLAGDGPVIVMVHGFKYAPGHPSECPHRQIFAREPARASFKVVSWPRGLGFDGRDAGEGLAIGFGWNARGSVWRAYAEAARAGAAFARLVAGIRAAAPHRPVHAIDHAFGAGVVLSALAELDLPMEPIRCGGERRGGAHRVPLAHRADSLGRLHAARGDATECHRDGQPGRDTVGNAARRGIAGRDRDCRRRGGKPASGAAVLVKHRKPAQGAGPSATGSSVTRSR